MKDAVKKVLNKHKGSVYYFMPVQRGYGKPSLDFLGFFRGLGFAIETKRPGEVPTPRQEQTIEDIQAGDARVFVIDGDTSELEEWLEEVDRAR